MARDGSLIGIAAVAVAGYFAWSSGLLGAIFGGSTTAAPAAGTPTNPASGAGTNPTTPATPAATPPACAPSNILAPLLANIKKLPNGAQYGDNLPGTFTIDEWGYYLNQMCSGMADQYSLNADHLFVGREDRGGPLNWSAFAGYARQAGLSAAPAWSGRMPSALPPGLVRALPAQAVARGRRRLVARGPRIRRAA